MAAKLKLQRVDGLLDLVAEAIAREVEKQGRPAAGGPTGRDEEQHESVDDPTRASGARQSTG